MQDQLTLRQQLMLNLQQIDFSWFPAKDSTDTELKGFFKLSLWDKQKRKPIIYGKLNVDFTNDRLALEDRDELLEFDFSQESQDGTHARNVLRILAEEGKNRGRVSVRVRKHDAENISVLKGITEFGQVELFTNVQNKWRLNVVSLG